jgi:RING-box protein 1
MADVEMTDAPSSAPMSKKKGGAVDTEGKEGKKRFEVKKVNSDVVYLPHPLQY